jgi:hypothetical protein
MVYCADNKLSFVHSKIDTVSSTPDTLARVDINFLDTYRESKPLGMGLNSHHYNYYYAHCPDGVTLTPSHNRVVYPQLYENTDLHIKGNNSWMKFEFVIHPGGDPEDILMTFEGADSVMLIPILDALVVTSTLGTYIFPEPKALEMDTVGNTVELSWQPDWDLSVTGDTIRFTNIGAYNPMETLVFRMGEELMAAPPHNLDNHEWQTAYGGYGSEAATDVDTDTDGNSLFVGYAESAVFPQIPGQATFNNGFTDGLDAFVVKFQAPKYTLPSSNEGDRLKWATYYGGTGDDIAHAVLAVGDDVTGSVYFVGEAEAGIDVLANGFPQQYSGGTDAFVAQLRSDNGTATWKTYFGGSGDEAATSITTDGTNIFVGGWTNSFASGDDCVTPTDNGFPICVLVDSYNQSSSIGGSAFIARFNGSNALTWSTLFGGDGADVITDMHHNGDQLYVGGHTTDDDNFPFMDPDFPDAYVQTTYGGGSQDGFLAVLTSGLERYWVTLFGGSGSDRIEGIITDLNGNLFVTGTTDSPDGADFADRCEVPPTGAFPLCDLGGGAHFLDDINLGASPGIGAVKTDAFIARFSDEAKMQWSSYFGGTEHDEANGITWGNDLYSEERQELMAEGEYIFICGSTRSQNIPLTHPSAAFSPHDGFILFNNYWEGAADPYSTESFLQMFDVDGVGGWGTTFIENWNSATPNLGNDRANAIHLHDSRQLYLASEVNNPTAPVLHANGEHFETPYLQSFTGAGFPNTGDLSDAVFTRMPFHFLVMTTVTELRSDQGGMWLYPNPGGSEFTLEWDAEQNENIELTMFDINGRLVKTQTLKQAHGSNRVAIDMAGVVPGVYIGRLRSATDTNFSFKWIKQ